MTSENDVTDLTAWMKVPVAYTREDKLLITQLAGVFYSPEQIQAIFLEIDQKQENLNKLRTDVIPLHTKRSQTPLELTQQALDTQLEKGHTEINRLQAELDEFREQHHLLIKAKYFAYEYTAPYGPKSE